MFNKSQFRLPSRYLHVAQTEVRAGGHSEVPAQPLTQAAYRRGLRLLLLALSQQGKVPAPSHTASSCKQPDVWCQLTATNHSISLKSHISRERHITSPFPLLLHCTQTTGRAQRTGQCFGVCVCNSGWWARYLAVDVEPFRVVIHLLCL